MDRRGFTLIELMIVIAIIAVIVAIALPNMLEARMGANETSAISSLRTITTAQHIFNQRDKEGDARADFAVDLDELAEADLIDEVLASAEKDGYQFVMVGSPFTWEARAVALAQGSSGKRSFFTDHTGVIRASQGSGADVTSMPVGD